MAGIDLAVIGRLLTLLALGGLAYLSLAGWRERRTGQSLAAFRQPRAQTRETAVPYGSPEHRIRLAAAAYGLDVSGWEQVARYGAIALLSVPLAFGMLALGRGPLLMLGGPVLAVMVVNNTVESQWHAYRARMVRELPLLMARLSSSLQVRQNVRAALADEVQNLDPKGPLREWLTHVVDGLAKGEKLARYRQEAHAISPALGLLITQLQRAQETGGGGYSDAFTTSALRLQEILTVQAEAHAVAASARKVIRNIVLMLGLSIVSMLRQLPPGIAPSWMNVGLLAMLGWAFYGWSYVNRLIAEVVE